MGATQFDGTNEMLKLSEVEVDVMKNTIKVEEKKHEVRDRALQERLFKSKLTQCQYTC
jgi:hypothetical protein